MSQRLQKDQNKNIVLRTCISCRKVGLQSQLVRISKKSDGKVSFDSNANRSGRGAYVCETASCLENALKKGRLERAIRGKIDRENQISLQQAIEKLVDDRLKKG